MPIHTPIFGVNIPAVTTKFENTNALILNANNTFSPVSGCNVASTTFFAFQTSSVISVIIPFLYCDNTFTWFLSWASDVKSVRGSQMSRECRTRPE